MEQKWPILWGKMGSLWGKKSPTSTSKTTFYNEQPRSAQSFENLKKTLKIDFFFKNCELKKLGFS